jgi:hypothetical protein
MNDLEARMVGLSFASPMTCVPNGMGMVVEIKYVPGGMYTMAFLSVDPLQPLPQRLPSSMAALNALVSSVTPFPTAP